jgi:hypothetical protein
MVDEIGIKDDIGKEITEEQRKSYIRQIDGLNDNLKQLTEAKENYQVQWNIDNELYQIIINGHKKVRTDFEYENDPRYWELREKQGAFKYREAKHLAESKLKSYDTQSETIQKELNSLQEALNKLDKGDE